MSISSSHRARRIPSVKEQKCRNMCRNYYRWDTDSRNYDLPKRCEEHLQIRRQVFEDCVYGSLDVVLKILSINDGQYFNHSNENHKCSKCFITNCTEHKTSVESCVGCEISFKIEQSLMENVTLMATQLRDQWSGVQVSQCKRVIETFKIFLEISFNRQDRTSWKFTGKHFYVPAIESALQKFNDFVNNLPRKFTAAVVDGHRLISVIYDLLCCGLIFFVMNFSTKFTRCKNKPLVPKTTLFNCQELIDIILKCVAGITVDKWRSEEIILQHKVKEDKFGRRLKRNVREVLHAKTKQHSWLFYDKSLRQLCRLLNVRLPLGFVDKWIKNRQQFPPSTKVHATVKCMMNKPPAVQISSHNYSSNNNNSWQMPQISDIHSNDVTANREHRRVQQMQQRQNSRQSAVIAYQRRQMFCMQMEIKHLRELLSNKMQQQSFSPYMPAIDPQYSYQQQMNGNASMDTSMDTSVPSPAFYNQPMHTYAAGNNYGSPLQPKVQPFMSSSVGFNNNMMKNESWNNMRMNVVSGDVSSNNSSSPHLPMAEGMVVVDGDGNTSSVVNNNCLVNNYGNGYIDEDGDFEHDCEDEDDEELNSCYY